MADLGATARAIKRVTLVDIYTALDALKNQQGENSRHVNQRIDNLNQKIDTEIGQVRQEIGQVNQRIDTLNQKIDTQIGQVNQRIDQLNQRFDTVIQMLLDLSKQISSQKKTISCNP